MSSFLFFYLYSFLNIEKCFQTEFVHRQYVDCIGFILCHMIEKFPLQICNCGWRVMVVVWYTEVRLGEYASFQSNPQVLTQFHLMSCFPYTHHLVLQYSDLIVFINIYKYYIFLYIIFINIIHCFTVLYFSICLPLCGFHFARACEPIRIVLQVKNMEGSRSLEVAGIKSNVNGGQSS